MFQTYRIAMWFVVLGLAVLVSGCNPPAQKEKQKTTNPATSAGPGEHANHAEAASAEVPPGLAKLSAEDRASAEKQRVCPVSGEVLGEMDAPIKVTVKGQTVFLCCPSCEKEIMKDPDKYLEKLKAKESK